MRAAASAIGIGMIVLVLLDAFETIVLPRRGPTISTDDFLWRHLEAMAASGHSDAPRTAPRNISQLLWTTFAAHSAGKRGHWASRWDSLSCNGDWDGMWPSLAAKALLSGTFST